MKQMIWPALAATALSCAVAVGNGNEYAKRAVLLEPAFDDPQLVVLESMPPQFELSLKRDMPTPGWSIEVDSIEIDEKSGRIEAKVTEIRPEGMVAQVITPTRLRLSLGKLLPGSYFVEIRLRRGGTGSYMPAQAFVLVAN